MNRVTCDACGANIWLARIEVRGDDCRFVCPDHPLPSDITHPIFVATK